ncbi:hypothetical protein [Yinghuangia sp. YIM S09857]|uniref:hypothetical protein n=1 Tax=Yinghuangia sp. YIM S09857 TaxID=3436929 RepID=UPI003F53CA9B
MRRPWPVADWLRTHRWDPFGADAIDAPSAGRLRGGGTGRAAGHREALALGPAAIHASVGDAMAAYQRDAS